MRMSFVYVASASRARTAEHVYLGQRDTYFCQCRIHITAKTVQRVIGTYQVHIGFCGKKYLQNT